MELESLELMNKEMNETLKNLEKEARRHASPSLHSIHSEDLLCLSKIRQLAEEELNLKNCIKQLEQKETLFKEHMDRLLTSKEYQNVCTRQKIVSCVQDLDCTGKRICYVPKKCLLHRQSEPRGKQGKEEAVIMQSDAIISTSEKNIEKRDRETESELPEEKTEKKSSWMPNWWSNNEKSDAQMRSTDLLGSSHVEDNETEKSNIVSINPQTQLPAIERTLKDEKVNDDEPPKLSKPKSKSAQCHRPCFTPQDLECILKKTCVGKHISPCKISCNKPIRGCTTSSRKPFCKLPRYVMEDHGIRTGCKPYMLSYDLRSPCEICPMMSCSRPIGSCRCNCKGKCARGLSDAPCNCNDDDDLLAPSEKHQLPGSKQLGEENSEDEFCECCSCGCQDSEESLCQCN